jgi:molecular chaperone DnaK
LKKTLGIDLGTTNSVIALLDATDSTLITGRDEQGRMIFPSLIGWHPEQQRLVAGRAAQALRGAGFQPAGRLETCPTTLPLSSVKRFMGLDRRFPLGPQSLTPPEASACVLRLLRDVMARTLDNPRFLLDAAVITMPAYFNHNQIEATRQAGELAGFEVVELLHEPTAAAIYYSWVEHHGDATYLVYDLGGGTFDVSVIRARLGDYEVLSVSGDPFLGGDDFDRMLAAHLIEAGRWTVLDAEGKDKGEAVEPAPLFDPTTPAGAVRFALLVGVAESIKTALTEHDRVERYVPGLAHDDRGRPLALEAIVERSLFQRLIKDKVDRTIDCCHEALARARERAGLRLGDVDHVILVGGSSRVPLVRETVRAAFGDPQLPEHVRNLQPLLHEPDLCVAYGAALRGATHGTRYVFALGGAWDRIGHGDNPGTGTGSGMGTGGLLPVPVPVPDSPVLELHFTSPANTRDTRFQATGVVRLFPPSPGFLEGGSVRIRSLATGLSEEAFLDDRGTFAQELELQPETDNALEFAVCDGDGREAARVVACVRHQAEARPLGQAVLPTQLITKPLAIEVLSRGRQRVKQVVAPVGATLPGVFRCTCRTQDQAGRIVVPIFEENRVVKQMVLSDLDPTLPVGSPVEVEFAIDVKHAIEVRVRVRPGEGRTEHSEIAVIEPPPPPRRPTRAEIDEVLRQLEELLPQFSGSVRTRIKAGAARLREDLLEALRFDDEPKAIQRMAELRDLVQGLEAGRGQALDPPWPRFAQLVRHCLDQAAAVADKTGRDRDELFEHIHAQERYAEQAYEEHNQALYRECRENLEKYAGYLEQLLRDALPRPSVRPSRPPEEEARTEVERFRQYLAAVWKQVRVRGRADLEARLGEIARQAGGLSQRIKTEPLAVLRDVNRLGTEVEKVGQWLEEGRRAGPKDDAGLLEGTS